ncbi:hypothetical protein Glove_8g41 [Diversispora epigaea]|uniref:TPX2 C-terminal domain-containing protein n=1 Tax=Diversispora epigaea TaxID=1348612 RepID=A0A397JP18_9GLOM|nr:hypothetical protein Glove_8g41 [Diversispora epigaea]
MKTNLTVPKSPKLRTKSRVKPSKFLPMEEQEILEMEQYKFVAKPINTKIFEVKELGVSKIGKPEIRKPLSPAITNIEPPPQRFTSSLPKIKFHHPIPDFKDPFMPFIEHRKMELPNFSLPGDEIHKRKIKEIQEKMLRERDEMDNARKFKAQPLPSDSPDGLPPRHYYALTYPKPFVLETDNRGDKYQQSFRERLRRINEIEKENRFHATPLPNFEPQIPKKLVIPPPTKPVEFIFNTGVRMLERKAFDEQRKMRDSIAEVLREQKRKEDEIREAEEIRHLRTELVHRAQPIKHFAPVNIRPSKRKPTRAVSPLIGEKRRKIMNLQEETSFQSSTQFNTNHDTIAEISSELKRLATIESFSDMQL